MKAMVLREYDVPMNLEEVPTPEPKGDEVLLKVGAAGVCGTDLKIARGKNRNVKLPRIMGHESAGEVVALGPNVRNLKVGDHVCVYMYITCGMCEFCLSGKESLCIARSGFYGNSKDGGFAEYMVVNEGNCVKVPNDMPWEVAAVLPDAVATSWHGVATIGDVRANQTVVIVGLGGLGMHGVQSAVACGGICIAVDHGAPDKLEVARKNGASYVIDANQVDFAQEVKKITGYGADVAVAFRGHPYIMEGCLKSLKPGGIAVIVGYTADNKPMALGPRDVMGNDFRIAGARGNTRKELADVVALTHAGRLNPVITQTMGLDGLNDAINQIGNGQVAGRIVLKP